MKSCGGPTKYRRSDHVRSGGATNVQYSLFYCGREGPAADEGLRIEAPTGIRTPVTRVQGPLARFPKPARSLPTCALEPAPSLLTRKHFAAFGIDAVGERPDDRQCFCLNPIP